MLLWYRSSFLIVALCPLVWSRHTGHGFVKRTANRHESIEEDETNVWPRSHLSLHVRPPGILNAMEGDSEVLECQAGGSPAPRIYWLKNGQLVSKIDQHMATLEDGKLDITSMISRLYLDCLTSRQDGDQYTCVAENAGHRKVGTTMVHVASGDQGACDNRKNYGKLPGEAPRIVTWTKTILENQGQDTRLKCSTEGDPMPKVTWFNNYEEEIEAENSPKYKILPNGDLVIRNLKWKDMGNYVCVAENSHGSARAETFLYPAKPDE